MPTSDFQLNSIHTYFFFFQISIRIKIFLLTVHVYLTLRKTSVMLYYVSRESVRSFRASLLRGTRRTRTVQISVANNQVTFTINTNRSGRLSLLQIDG